MEISSALKEKINFEKYIQDNRLFNLRTSCFKTFLFSSDYEDDIVTRRLKEGVIVSDELKQDILLLSNIKNTHERLTLFLQIKRLNVS